MKKQVTAKETSIFASANSFRGFISQYGELFNSRKFNKIFVIKGGPGTGKSSLMKRIKSHVAKSGAEIESIYCSSDPHSLDGLIVFNGKTRIGLLDGTAPHERDAIFPGVTDEIINLAEGLDETKLNGQREKIYELTELKSRAYKRGYDLLGLAGEISRLKRSLYSVNDIYIWAESFCGDLFRDIDSRDSAENHFGFSSAFSKLGKTVLEDNLPRADDVIIRADGFYEYIAMRVITAVLTKKCIHYSIISSPLSEDLIDVIITPQLKIYASSMFDNSTVIDCDGKIVPSSELKLPARLVEIPALHLSDNVGQFLTSSYRDALICAQDYFKEAAVHHLSLEAIYTDSMDFSSNDRYYDYIASKIDSLL